MTVLASLYETLLDGLNVTQSPNGDLSYLVGSATIPLMIEDKRLVMPSDEVLRSGMKSDRVAFHPLSEKPMRGESDVFKKLRGLVTTKLTSSIATMAVKILEIAADPTTHKKLPAEAKKLLKQVATADEKTVKAFGKLVYAMAEHPEGRLVKIYTRRSAQVDGVNYLRVASLQFPFMDCFEEGKKEVLGVKLRDKDLESIQGVIEAILPSVRVANTYSAGSNSMTAPYMVSLLTAYARIAARINEVDALFSKVNVAGDEDEAISINLAWVDLINNPDAYQGQIPVLIGNEGAVVKGDEEVDREIEVPDERANARNGIKPLAERRDDDAPPFKADAPKETTAAVTTAPAQIGQQPSLGVSFSRPAPAGASVQQRRNLEEAREDRGRDVRRDNRGNDHRGDDRRYETRSDRSDRGDRSWGNDGSRWEDGRGRGRDDRDDRYNDRDRGRGRDDRDSRYRDDRDDRGSRYRDDRDDRGRDRYRDDRNSRGGSGRDRSANDTFGRGGRGSGGI